METQQAASEAESSSCDKLCWLQLQNSSSNTLIHEDDNATFYHLKN